MRSSTFVVMGRPVPKARPRIGGKTKRAYTPQKTRAYEETVRLAWLAQSRQKMDKGRPLRAVIDVYYAVPESYSRLKREAALSCGAWYKSRPDLDNVLKAVLDALNGYCYDDDALIVEVHATKRYAQDNKERVYVCIEEI